MLRQRPNSAAPRFGGRAYARIRCIEFNPILASNGLSGASDGLCFYAAISRLFLRVRGPHPWLFQIFDAAVGLLLLLLLACSLLGFMGPIPGWFLMGMSFC